MHFESVVLQLLREMVYLEGVKLDFTQLREQDDCTQVTDHVGNSSKNQVGILHHVVGSLFTLRKR